MPKMRSYTITVQYNWTGTIAMIQTVNISAIDAMEACRGALDLVKLQFPQAAHVSVQAVAYNGVEVE